MLSEITNFFSGDYLSVDQLSLYFVMLVILIGIPVVIYSKDFVHEFRNKYSIGYLWAMMFLFMAGMIGVALSNNSICFIFFWELMSVFSFLLVIYEYNSKENLKSGIMYFIMTHISGLFIMMMFGLLYQYTGEYEFHAIAAKASMLSNSQRMSVLILGLIGFGAKAGLLPLHAWLPKAHPAAPSNVPALTSGVMLKIAVYGFIRVSFVLIKEVPLYFSIAVMLVGALSAVYAIFNGLFQEDIKKLLAYSSAENIGIIFSVLGLSLIFRHYDAVLLSELALVAALFHIMNHAIFKSLLFSCAGSVMYATGSKNMNELGGLHGKLRITAICTVIGAAAISAVPPLNGFASEILIFKSFIEASNIIRTPEVLLIILLCGITMAITSGLVLWASIKFFGITFLGAPRSKKARDIRPVPKSMNLGMSIMATYAVLAGVFSPFLINWIGKIADSITGIDADIVDIAFGYEITIVSLCLLVLLVVIKQLSKRLDKQSITETGDTWGCGFHSPKSFMQYSGSGLSQPAARFMGVVACYEKEVRIKNTIYLRQRFADWIEKYLYTSVIAAIDFLSGKIVKIHHGKIQAYISYIFISLIFSLVLVINFL